jgi:hypothetical protein
MSGVTEDQLAALFIGNSAFAEIEAAFDRFCPFEAVGVIRQEIRHGQFLEYVFNPQRPHGFGSDCLQAFFHAAATAASAEEPIAGFSPLDIHLMELDNAVVRREWRNIDLLIEVPSHKLIVAVELKIDASEHSGQLKRYRETVETNWPRADGWKQVFVFLTKRGDEPSSEDGTGWLTLELEAVTSEMHKLVEREVGAVDARRLLQSYIDMLRRHHLTNERLEQLASKLWAEHGAALEYLVEQRPDAVAELFRQLFTDRERLAAAMTEAAGTEIVPDHCTPGMLRFAVTAWDDLPNYLTADWTPSKRHLLIEIVRGGRGRRTIRMYVLLGKGNQAVRQKVYQALESADVAERRKRQFTGDWTRLSSVNLMILPEEEEFPFDQTLRKIEDSALKYVAGKVPAFSSALDSLRN